MPRHVTRTLRRELLLSGLLVVSVAAAAMLGSVSLAMSQRDAVERDSDAFMEEQRIADQIVALTYQQQLGAYRYLQHPDTLYLRSFRARGDEAYREIRGYLFHELSAEARLQVESIKETHEQFEVAAERAFELAQRGQSGAARLRLAGMDRRADALDRAVGLFLRARALQRAAFQREHEILAVRLQIALFLATAALVVLVVVLTSLFRRRVILPLDHLATAARQLGEGDTTARVPPQPFGEFDVVAAGFNQMADRVQASREKVVAQNHELHDALAHLRATQDELVQHEKLSAMGQMLAGLAHELNNPLAGILGLAECLRDELNASPHADARALSGALAEPLEREALRANALVRSLLSFSRKPSGSLESVGLAAAVSTAVGLRAHAFAQAGKTVHVDVLPDLHVMADVQKLQHVMVNLINNALDAIIEGGGHGVTITAAPDGDAGVRVDVDDDGPGIADITAAFEPFYTTKPAGKGTGIGLGLVKRFMSECGGTVTATNRETGGARVTLHLQIGAAPVQDGRPPAEPRAPGHASRPAPSRDRVSLPAPEPSVTTVRAAGDGGRRRVLIADDEPAIREIGRRLLSRAGLDVLVAASGVEAREILRREHVDLVVSDLRMPGAMDGAALLAWLALERPELARHALLVTGDVSGAASVALPVPAHRVLHKPVQGAEFVRRVRLALGLAPLTDETDGAPPMPPAPSETLA